MRELPEETIMKLWENSSHGTDRETVEMIYRQAYEDGLRDAANAFKERAGMVTNPTIRLAMKAHAEALLTASRDKCEPVRTDYGVSKPHPFKD